ncbi:MAG: hypothetical protein ACR2LK_02710 [Solirubrobacteraceae bacterium]
MRDDGKIVDRQRLRIRQHIEIYNRHKILQDKQAALSKIRAAQAQIAMLTRRNRQIISKPEDFWRP